MKSHNAEAYILAYMTIIFPSYRLSRIESGRYGICVIRLTMLRAYILEKNYNWESQSKETRF